MLTTSQSTSKNQLKHNTKKEMPFIFARHETFHIRYGWLKKGFDMASIDQAIFSKDDAPIKLGVGKNMVKSIRYWCSAFKILEEQSTKGTKSRKSNPTDFGSKLLDDAGWDPYLEDPASLWLLHWNFLKTPCIGTAWNYLFNYFNFTTFTVDDLFNELNQFTLLANTKNTPNPSSISKDINCLLRMYAPTKSNKNLTEDSLDCPFNELRLINTNENDKSYSFNIGVKNNLPSEIIVSTCLDYISSIEHTSQTIAVSRLCYDIGSPGQVFKLTESAIYNAIEEVSRSNKKITISDTAGLMQFIFSGDPKTLAGNLLKQYYKKGT